MKAGILRGRKSPTWDFNYVIDQINGQIKRVGKTLDYWKKYLLGKYNVASRLLLSDQQILEFWSSKRGWPCRDT